MIYEATASAISSPASEAGASACAWPDGPMTDLFGQALAPASRSAPPASSVAATMSATYGLRSSGSSQSAALAAFLASRLPALLDSRGSTMFAQTWKAQATPLRRRISAHTASAHRTSGSGCTGWPTPAAHEPGGTPEQHLQRKRDAVARGVQMGSGAVTHLSLVAQYAPWPTCKSSDGEKGARTHRGAMKELNRKGPGSDLPTIAAAAWPTPQTFDQLPPKSGEALARNKAKGGCSNLREHVMLTLGPPSNGSSAATEKPGQLNPAFSRWLMGYPAEWDDCAPTATRSSRKSPQRS